MPIDTSPPLAADPLRRALESALGAQYEFVRLLGRGGMGAVYLARDRVLERAVAVKALPPDVAGTADALERFKREARTVAALTHPNIVPLFAIGEAFGLGYYVMGYVRGESLADRMNREGRLPAEDVRRIIGELADALDYAHRLGVVHRDVKPDNVLLDDVSGRPMLTDFGIAKAQISDRGETLTRVGTVVGTPAYMSPEQASGDREIDGRSDLYSLGVVGYAMLAGRLPFDARNTQDALVQHLTVEPRPLAQLAPDAPDDVVGAIMRCLRKNPADRWPDGKSLRQALGADVAGEGALPPDLRQLVARGPLCMLLVVATIVLVAAAAVRDWQFGPFNGGVAFYPLLFVVNPLIETWRARRLGRSWHEIRRVALWQPTWWVFTWPRRWSRPGDVWPRLPRTLQRARYLFTVGMVSAIGVIVGATFVSPLTSGPWSQEVLLEGPYPTAWLTFLGVLIVTLPVVVLAVVGAGCTSVAMGIGAVYGRRHGFSIYTGASMTTRPTLSPFWAEPDLARVFVVPSVSRVREEPRTPHDFLRAVATLADQLRGPARSVGAQAVAAARELVTAIDTAAKEAADLRMGAGADEIRRLEQRISALGAGDGVATDVDVLRLRTSLADQLAAQRRLEARADAALERRSRALSMLQAIWTELSHLHDAASVTTDSADLATVPAAGDRLRELCATTAALIAVAPEDVP